MRKKILENAFGFKLSHHSIMLFDLYMIFILFILSTSTIIGLVYELKGQ